MPSFLSKVFGRRRDENLSPRGRSSDGSLLDGKFEAVSPTISPIVADFPENARGSREQGKGKGKEGGFGFFKIKSRPSSPERLQPRDNLPQLPLLLPISKEDTQPRPLSINFELDPNTRVLADAVIDNKRLNPSEALTLIRACSQAINARGLETLGLMRPHWYSASPETQRRLISLFVHSLTANTSTTSPSTPSLSTSAFESEVNYTRSPHDIASVLRWGLRHLELDGNSFGKEDSWYTSFADAEKNSDYPPKAYSQSLLPLVPSSHIELLNAVLELFATLSAHAEKNSTSGSKLTRTFGFWLLAVPRVIEGDDWSTFYARWARAGRMLEHLFLARIRDESLRIRLPKRLIELVTQYPYTKGASAEDDVYLFPRLSTTQYGALFVRVEAESSSKDKLKWHPLHLVAAALDTEVTAEKNEYTALWEKIKNASSGSEHSSPGGSSGFSRVFADETIRYLALVPGDHPMKDTASPTLRIAESPETRQRPSSPEEKTKSMSGPSVTPPKPMTELSPLPPPSASPLEPDWTQFSTAGFSDTSPAIVPLASTLFGQDMEKTNPPVRKTSKRAKASSGNVSRKSTEAPQIAAPMEVAEPKPKDHQKLISRSSMVSMIQVDEAFIEFWTDALLDPISSNWPTFVFCRLNPSIPDITLNDKRLEWLVIEHKVVPEPQPAVSANEAVDIAAQERMRASSPRPSTKSEKRFFNFFTNSGRRSSIAPTDKSVSGKGWKKSSPEAKVGELGEVLREEDEKPSTTVKLRIPSPKPRKSVDVSRRSVDVSRKSMDGTRKSVDAPKEMSQKETKPLEPQEINVETQAPAATVDITNVLSAEAKPVSQDVAVELPVTEVKDKANGIASPEPEPLANQAAAGEKAGNGAPLEGATSPAPPTAASAADVIPTPSDTLPLQQEAIDADISAPNDTLDNEVKEPPIGQKEVKEPESELRLSTEQVLPSASSASPETEGANDTAGASDGVVEEVAEHSSPLGDSMTQEDLKVSEFSDPVDVIPVLASEGPAKVTTVIEEAMAGPITVNEPAVNVPVTLTTTVDAPVAAPAAETVPIDVTAAAEPVSVVDDSETVPQSSGNESEQVMEASTPPEEVVGQQPVSTPDAEHEVTSERTTKPTGQIPSVDDSVELESAHVTDSVGAMEKAETIAPENVPRSVDNGNAPIREVLSMQEPASASQNVTENGGALIVETKTPVEESNGHASQPSDLVLANNDNEGEEIKGDAILPVDETDEASAKDTTEPVQPNLDEPFELNVDQVHVPEEVRPVESTEEPTEAEAVYVPLLSPPEVQVQPSQAAIHTATQEQGSTSDLAKAADVDTELAPAVVNESGEQDAATTPESLNMHPAIHASGTEDSRDTVLRSSDADPVGVDMTATPAGDLSSNQVMSTAESSSDLQHPNDPMESVTGSDVVQDISANGEPIVAEEHRNETALQGTPSEIEDETAQITPTMASEPIADKTDTTKDAVEGQDASKASSSTVEESENPEEAEPHNTTGEHSSEQLNVFPRLSP